MLDMLIAGGIFLLAVLLAVGTFGAMSALIGRVLSSLMGSADCAGLTQVGELERAHAEAVLAHFENIRAAAIDDDWELFHTLNDELRVLDPGAWAEFNDGLRDANVPARRTSKRRRRTG
ncbi:MAG TPA: hypothetical protein PK789_10240 [Thermomonas sp.]|jgi:hypothetical protein|uniref:hypothetical protein n=1 Tax=Thermomonas sp. TaxID=1971895 RepID=UPI002C138F70|nr:hypothetical protein [Thermomonas sp.]HOV97125.1 hypothetical protein [Thermomonas sp.]